MSHATTSAGLLESDESPAKSAVQLAGVSYRHAGGQLALHDIELQIAQGERVALIGPSGAGKTTLLRLLATHLEPVTGQLDVLGDRPWSLSAGARQKLRSRIGLIHQAPPLPPRQRVITSVLAGRLGQWSLVRSLLSLIYPLDKDGAAQALGKLDLADKLYARCDQLSGGQLQRVGIARALYQSPELILSRQATLLASLHVVELALEHFPRVIGVRDGRILFDKPTSQVMPAELEALYANEQLGSSSVLQAMPGQPLQIPRC